MKNLSGKFHEKFVRKISCRAKPTKRLVSFFGFFCQENFMKNLSGNFMKNLLGKFHAELSQQSD
jgi:hypothetical protein